MKKKDWRTVGLGNVIVLLLTAIIFLSSTLETLTYSLYDFNMKQSMTNAPHEDIVVIGINDSDLKTIGTFPWDRDVYVPLLHKLKDAKVVGFDITFSTESKDPAHDIAFVEELKKHKNVIIPLIGMTEGAISRKTTFNSNGMSVRSVDEAMPEIAAASIPAHINRIEDNDKTIRQSVLQIQLPDGRAFPSLALKTAELAGAGTGPYLNAPGKVIDIRYDAHSYDFFTVSFHDVISGKVPEEVFKDRIVFVGMTAAGYDQGKTPVDNSMYLVYAHANIVNQLLQGSQVKVALPFVSVLLIMLLLAVTAVAVWRMKAIASMLYVFAAAAVLLVGQYFIFSNTSWFVETVYPIAALFLAYLANIAMKTFYETKQKNFITKQFGRYISPELVKEIASSGQELQLGGINKELSILFLDIRGFTTLSERLKPEEVVDFLNTMFDMITDRALKNQGSIDKFIGDAAMILFNAPLDVEEHPYCAVKTAWDIQQGMKQVREEIEAKYGVTISCGIGIHTGDVVVGNIGSYLRVDYTAIGDNVNTAARIESQTTANQILISEATHERVKEFFDVNFVGEKMMKGKTVGVKLFEITGHKGIPVSLAGSKDVTKERGIRTVNAGEAM
ncbi:CHASE2 domain-containing protein [Paenibacillus turpanensis]|uniref:CHASE2 domain-containing protein n=1 Tax=Paenibacillus turpanensis TaxID=2689078 RepID=UPI001408F9CB|nr:adenylate/guanylate cyclase domain-containing protein [Paenibacillus turpanensis]